MKLAAATAVAVLILDQITKLIALERLAPGLPVSVVDGFASLTLVMNPGLAFGLLSSTPTAWRWVDKGLVERRRRGARTGVRVRVAEQE